MKIDDLDFYLVCRFYIYKSFYLLFFKPINRASMQVLGDKFIAESCSGSDDTFQMNQYGQFLAHLLNQAKNKKFLDTLQSEYTRLFLGPHKLIAPPWQSVYDSKDKTLFTYSTLEVRAKYAKYGLKTTKYLSEADDHLAFELNFMLYLAGLANENLDIRYEILKDSADFLDKHLLSWIGDYLWHLDSYRSIYVNQISAYLKKFLQNDRIFLKDILSYGSV